MADVHDKTTRHYNMSQIKNKDTKPETIVRRYLFSHGFRFRKNDTRYPGTPDIILPKYRTAIFVNGCFWHKHEGCKYFVWPKSNTDFWGNKINKNVERDQRNYMLLRELGWHIIVIWECELKKDVRETTLQNLVHELRST